MQRIAIATLVVAGATRVEAQDAIDVRAIKPVMMLLVDTSGSMERMTNETRLPNCTDDVTNDATEKNRWTVTLEALTGTYSAGSYSCKEIDRATLDPEEMDYGYYLPHFEITSPASAQASDGILDAFKTRLKFGLMTFDGAGTTLTGDSLRAYDDFSVEPLKSQDQGPEGMYSYGELKPLVFPGCPEKYGYNAGARREISATETAFPGALISVGSDNDVENTNETIQTGLGQIRPFGSTPLAAMFDDLKYYIEHNTDIKKDSDPFYECRDRYALLLTDSAGDANELFRDQRFRCDAAPTDCQATANEDCVCPYDTDVNLVDSLTAGTSPELKKLFILAFNVNDPDALADLDELADHGKTDKAFRASTPTELRQQLSSLMSSVQTEATSRSVPVSVDTGASVLLGGHQYEITAGFSVGDTTDPNWSGLLYRRRIGCDADALPAELPFDDTPGHDLFHVTLNDQLDSTRNLYTLAPVVSGETHASAARGTARTSDALADAPSGDISSRTNDNQPENGASFSGSLLSDGTINQKQALVSENLSLVEFKDASALYSDYFDDADGNGVAGEDSDRKVVTDWVRGLSRVNKMADIYHSNPAVLPPLNQNPETLAAADERVTAFRRQLLALDKYANGRPGVVFVGTNDGILHAFNLEDTTIDGTDYRAGYEFWGFIPPAVFPKMHSAASLTHQLMFDGTPVISDVIAPRDDGDTATPTFSTVLVSAVRGAPAFVALDITHPELLKPLWQVSDEYMGDTVGTPAITHVMVNWKGTVQQRAVAILPGGAGSTANTSSCSLAGTSSEALYSPDQRSSGRCWKLPGRSLYVVDIVTGQIIQRFDPRHFNAPMTGAVAVDARGLGVSKAAYLSDQDGILWRLSMLNTDPSKWRVQPVWDLFGDSTYNGGRPSTFAPLLTRDDDGNNVIVVGTGDLDNLVDSVAQRVTSLTEQRDVDSTGEMTGTFKQNWQITLNVGESVTGPLVLFQKTVYFGTFASLTDATNACTLGQSRLFGAHYRETDPDDPTLPLGQLAEDADNDGVPETPVKLVLSDETESDALVLGVAITRQPVCMAGTPENDPNFLNALGTGQAQRFSGSGPASGGTFTLKALAGGTGGDRVAGSALHQVSQALNVTEHTSVASWAGSVE
jgi:type IV pilus assembly protein PilY1